MASRFRTLEISNSDFEPESLRFVTVKSEHLKGRADCTFFIPKQIQRITENVPVVILLHGVYGSHWAWTYNINVHKITLQLIEHGKIKPMVLVMPSDGLMGDGSGYMKHGEMDYEKWIIEDVVDLIGEVIPVEEKMNLFIAGLSMGGYGALRLMAKYPTKFKGASGLSSITDMEGLLPFLSPDEQTYFKSNSGGEKLITYLVSNKKKLPPFRFDCGLDDPLLFANRLLHEQLSKEGFNHVYEEFAGGHNNDYWNQNISKSLLFFNDLMKHS